MTPFQWLKILCRLYRHFVKNIMAAYVLCLFFRGHGKSKCTGTVFAVGHATDEFNSYFTYGMLQKLLLWVKVKQHQLRSLQSDAGNLQMSLPTDLTSLVHLVVRQYDSNSTVPGTSSSVPLQLKSTLPDFRSLSRSVRSFVASNASCCSIAYCLYVTDNASSVSVPRTVKERVARLRQNPWYRDYEQLHDRTARQTARSDESVRHAESSSRRLSRQSEEVRLEERARDRSARQSQRQSEEVRLEERARDRSARQSQRQSEEVRLEERARCLLYTSDAADE